LISALGDQPFSVDARNFEQARAAQKVLICEACFKDRNSTIELAPEVKQSQNGNSGFTFPQLEPIYAPSLRSIFALHLCAFDRFQSAMPSFRAEISPGTNRGTGKRNRVVLNLDVLHSPINRSTEETCQ
jgi:hypothetical protein